MSKKVHEIAREINRRSREVIEFLREKGVSVTNPGSLVEESHEAMVKEYFASDEAPKRPRRPKRHDRSERPEHRVRPERKERPKKLDKSKRPERPQKPERKERPERPVRPPHMSDDRRKNINEDITN